MRLDKNAIKNNLDEQDIKLILSDLGSSSPKNDSQGNHLYQTVCHSGHKHKLYYYPEDKTFRCYTDCQESFDIYELVIKVKKNKGIQLTFYDAVRYISTLTGKVYTSSSTFDNSNPHLINDWDWINKFKKIDRPSIQLPTLNPVVLDLFLKYPHELWLNEGISSETIGLFNIGYYSKLDCITLPHFNIDNDLVGIRGRMLLEEDVGNGRKYMPINIEGRMLSHATMFNLYGLNITKSAVRRLKKAILFEDEKSVLKCQDYYGENNFAVATGGSALSTFQVNLLLSQGIEEVFIARDKEFEQHESEKAYEYAERLKKQAYMFTPYIRTYILWDEWNLLNLKDSPADKGKEVLEELMRRKFEIKTKQGEV